MNQIPERYESVERDGEGRRGWGRPAGTSNRRSAFRRASASPMRRSTAIGRRCVAASASSTTSGAATSRSAPARRLLGDSAVHRGRELELQRAATPRDKAQGRARLHHQLHLVEGTDRRQRLRRERPEDYQNRRYNYGPASYDRRHVFMTTYTYRFPSLQNWGASPTRRCRCGKRAASHASSRAINLR